MNYCYLTEKLCMTPDEIYKKLSEAKSNYIDLGTNKWNSEKTVTSIRVKKWDSILSDEYLPEKLLSEGKYDEYTNQITSMSWQELREYIENSPQLEDILHAAFIIDIAERNCIPLTGKTNEQILKIKSKEPLVFFSLTYKRTYDALSLLETCNKKVYQQLNFIMPKDALVRV